MLRSILRSINFFILISTLLVNSTQCKEVVTGTSVSVILGSTSYFSVPTESATVNLLSDLIPGLAVTSRATDHPPTATFVFSSIASSSTPTTTNASVLAGDHSSSSGLSYSQIVTIIVSLASFGILVLIALYICKRREKKQGEQAQMTVKSPDVPAEQLPRENKRESSLSSRFLSVKGIKFEICQWRTSVQGDLERNV